MGDLSESPAGGLPTADLLTATDVANLMGLAAVSTLVRWLDAKNDGKNAPPAIERAGRYVFRPSVVVGWMEPKGYLIPASLYERAKRERAA